MTAPESNAGAAARDEGARPVVLSGCSGGGKSSLLDELARRGWRTVPEAGRQVVREELERGGDGLPWVDPVRFVDLALSWAVGGYEDQPTGEGPCYFDRSIVDLVAYLAFCGRETPPHVAGLPEIHRYHHTVFMTPPWRDIFGSDMQRRKTFEQAVAEYHALVAVYRRFGYRICVIPRGSITWRADFVESAAGRSP
jgi:predicted ATPase